MDEIQKTDGCPGLRSLYQRGEPVEKHVLNDRRGPGCSVHTAGIGHRICLLHPRTAVDIYTRLGTMC